MALTDTVQVILPPIYSDIYQDYTYYSIVLKSIIKDFDLFQIFNNSLRSLLYNFRNRTKNISLVVSISDEKTIKYYCNHTYNRVENMYKHTIKMILMII